MIKAKCPRCALVGHGDEEIETKFGYRTMGTKKTLQSWCRTCRSGKTIEQTQEMDKEELEKVKRNIKSCLNRLGDLESVRSMFTNPDGLNYDPLSRGVPVNSWSKMSRQIIEKYNVEITQIAEKSNVEVIYVDIDTNDEREWKRIAKELFKRRVGYCLIVTNNPKNSKKWLFTGGINSGESSKNILLEITDGDIPTDFVDWMTKIKASDNETLTTLMLKINSSFDDYAIDVQDKLGENVFKAFRTLINEVVFNKENNLTSTNDLTITSDQLFTLLYRLVFVLYAESRDIFDTNNSKYYEDFSLKKIVHTFMKKYEKNPESIRFKGKYEIWTRLKNLFSLIENGSKYSRIDEKDLDMPAYNGSLFNSDGHPELNKWKFNNEPLIEAIHSLTRIQDKEKNYSFVNYTTIEIRHIGTVYEKLLEFHPERRGKRIEIFTHEGKREVEGTYYTPKFIVDNIVENALGPLVDKIIENTKNPKDQVEKVLQLKILDPAMGSGHFLVGAADYLGKQLIKIDNDDTEQNFIKRKRDVVRRCLYGVDINPLAVELAKMSLWLDTLSSEHALSFLTTHLKNGDAILSSWRSEIFDKQTFLTEDPSRSYFRDFVKQYSAFETIDDHRASTVRSKIEEERETRKEGSSYDHLRYLLDVQLSKFYDNKIEDWRELRSKIGTREFNKIIKRKDWVLNRQISRTKKFFHWELEFPQVFVNEQGEQLANPGFDVIIGNPPYGVKYDGKYYKTFELGNKDSYGFFMKQCITLLKNDGIFSMVVSDTWRTLKTYRKLRDVILSDCTISRLIKLSRYAFKTYGRNIDAFTIICEFRKTKPDKESRYLFYDFWSVHPMKERGFFYHLMEDASYGRENEPWNFDITRASRVFVNQEKLLKTENKPIIEGGGQILNLFLLDNELVLITDRDVHTNLYARHAKIDDDKSPIVLLCQIGDTVSGLSTGDNSSYISQEGKGSYKIVNKIGVLKRNELYKIQRDNEFRKLIARNGISKREFHGRTVVPYDKGGSSDIDSGRLNNYFAPTKFFIDWSRENVHRIKTLKVSDKQASRDKNSNNDKIASRFQNVEYYFRHGITFSPTGLYAPTYRINSGGIFDSKGSCIFLKREYRKLFSSEYILGILCSKFSKYVLKNFISNTVESSVGVIESSPIPVVENPLKIKIENEVKSIIKKQKRDLKYDYQNHEQIKIDELVYEAFKLNKDTIREVEDWYKRRYPKLSSL